MWNKNVLIERLKMKHPIIQAGMAGGTTTPNLVAAVSNSGCLGTLGAGYMNPVDMKDDIRQIKQLTQFTYGVNLFIPEYPNVAEGEIKKANALLEPYRKELHLEHETEIKPLNNVFGKQIEVILEEKVPVCSFTFGVPSKEVIRDLKKEGVIVIGTATTVEEALINEEKGVDMIVAQGSEAGGHRGTFLGPFENALIGTMALIPQVVDEVKIPVIAAGGIMDGRGIVASLALGAQAVQMGTAFVTSTESGANVQHKEAILQASENRTVITSAFSGKPARGIQNRFINEMKEYDDQILAYPLQNTLTKAIRKAAAINKQPEYMSLWSGQSPRLSMATSATKMIESIILQAERVKSSF